MSKEGRAQMSSSSNQGKNKEENSKLDNKSPFLFSFLSPGNEKEEEGIALFEINLRSLFAMFLIKVILYIVYWSALYYSLNVFFNMVDGFVYFAFFHQSLRLCY